MHSSRLTSDTREARVYAYLREREKTVMPWCSTLEINAACQVTCGSTFVSSLRRQLPPGETIPPAKRVETADGRRWFYRIVREGR